MSLNKPTPTNTDTNMYPFLPNPLDSITSTTYHLRLYMCSIEDIVNNNVLDRSRQITIAESGVTGLGIDDFILTTVPGMTVETGTGESTTLSFKIQEPHGSSMLDQLYASAVSLGIDNYLKAPYFMELTFKGRTTTSSLPSVMKAKWVFPITITKMDMVVTGSGTTYDFVGAVYSELGYTNQYGDMQQGISLSGKTVGEMLEKLKQSLNDRQPQRASNKQLKPDKYEIIISDERLINAPLKISNSDQTIDRLSDYVVDDNSVTTVQFYDNTSIQYIIETIINSTEVIEKEIAGSDVPAHPQFNPDPNRSMVKKLYRVLSQVDTLEYDPGRGDYARNFRYVIVPYDTMTIVASKDESRVTPESSENRFNEYLGRSVLRKHYNYLFTGLNDQILDFNLKFNFMWYATLPRQTGTVDTYTSVDPGRRMSPDQLLLKQKMSTSASVKSKFNSTVTPGTDRQDPRNVSTVDTNTEQSSLVSKGRQARIRENTNADPDTDQETEVRQNAIQFIEDATADSLSKLPITTIETPDTSNDDIGVEDNYHAGKSFLSSLFSQIMYDDNAELLKIDLSIKGDPYWLGPPTTNKISTVEDRINSTNTSYVNPTSSQVFFLFTSQTPNLNYIEGTVTSSMKQNTIINGIYQVIVVKHVFSKGIFRQELQAVRDKLTDITDIDIQRFNQ
ncbi:structural protein [Pseudomonas phage vB_PaeM_PA5oct]|uniref:Structural protein n=1 Tax=Pseudomonas phage vB_PaeM_PA5oct TaxID=2163605 RepID=A0A4Y1LUF3_9CAUD|nr:virion structural protein [Pseudomonas phage vB_PaeM_PA5oct]QCG76016.1 structural protein [Pseudomonas phage vB_PaeM_PA5oct]BDR25908.1 hypothetical protein RVBP16_3480 [Pseudomonas phage sp. 30-2]